MIDLVPYYSLEVAMENVSKRQKAVGIVDLSERPLRPQ